MRIIILDEYDVFIAGGGIAGSVAANFCAMGGLKTLFVEKKKTPRDKSCSGIQFGYFEKIIGEKFPKEILCTNQLKKIEITYPNGKTFQAPFKMYNFMRITFDDWLNKVAMNYGAEFRDECVCTDFEQQKDGVLITLSNKGSNTRKIKAKYCLDATGLRPFLRQKMKPQDFQKKSSGGALNYYIKEGGNLDPNVLYQIWNLDYNNMMFAWIYKKSELWVIGTGYDKDVKNIQELFFDHVKKKYNISTNEIVKKEGFFSRMNFNSENRVWLGEGRILMIGDAAGLVDLVRGVGMDSAALSGRLAAKAIKNAEKNGKNALKIYTHFMRKAVKQTKDNQGKGINRFENNEELQNYLDKNFKKMGISMILHNFLNRFRSAEDLKLLPP
jgi:flavin-dependent dehydrogenase